jgi:hypothetical protein
MNGSKTIKALSLTLLLSISAAQAYPGMIYFENAWNAVPSKSELVNHATAAWARVPSKDALMQTVQDNANAIAEQARVGAALAANYAHNGLAVLRAHTAPLAAQACESCTAAFDVVEAHPYVAMVTLAGATMALGGYLCYANNKADKAINDSTENAVDQSVGAETVKSNDVDANVDAELMQQAWQDVLSQAYDFTNIPQDKIEIFLENEAKYRYAQLLGEEAEEQFLAKCLSVVLAAQAEYNRGQQELSA